jgi:hypothetical protein
MTGRTVTFSRGCRQSAFAGAVGGNGVGVSTSSQSCSTDLCNTGDGLGASINFPGFNSNGFGFNTNSNNNNGFGGFASGGVGGFNNDFNRQPGNGAPAGTKTNCKKIHESHQLINDPLFFFGINVTLQIIL